MLINSRNCRIRRRRFLKGSANNCNKNGRNRVDNRFTRPMNYKSKLCLFLSAFLVLIGFCVYFSWAIPHVAEVLLEEKRISRQFDIDLICDEIDLYVEQDKNWETYRYRQILSHMVSKIDATPGTYAELFDDNFVTMSERTPLVDAAPFDPREYPQLNLAMKTQDRGEMKVWFDKKHIQPYDMHVYWRWVPTNHEHSHRLLVVIGVSKYSLDSSISGWITYGAVALIVTASMFIVGCVIFITTTARTFK